MDDTARQIRFITAPSTPALAGGPVEAPLCPDLALANVPSLAQGGLEPLAESLKLWQTKFESVNKGSRDTYTRCVAWLALHHALGVGTLDADTKNWLSNDGGAVKMLGECRLGNYANSEDHSIAVRRAANHLIKLWKATGHKSDYAGYPPVPVLRRLRSAYELARVLGEATRLQMERPRHADRDVSMSCIGQPNPYAEMTAEPTCDCEHSSGDAPKILRYPAGAPASLIRSDYLFKAALELVLSPHIHREWKTDLLSFWAGQGSKVLDRLGPREEHDDHDDSGVVVDDRGESRYSDFVVLPRAANLWDFCRGNKPPSDVEIVILNAECPPNPLLASGAGPWCLAHSDFLRSSQHRGPVCRAAANAIESTLLPGLRAFARLPSVAECVTTTAWRECGDVLMLNFHPLTTLHPPSSLSFPNLPADYFVSAVFRSVSSSKQKRGTVNPNSKVRAVTFGCTASRHAASLFHADQDMFGVTAAQLHSSTVGRQLPVLSRR